MKIETLFPMGEPDEVFVSDTWFQENTRKHFSNIGRNSFSNHKKPSSKILLYCKFKRSPFLAFFEIWGFKTHHRFFRVQKQKFLNFRFHQHVSICE
jgi:hypothetical protein